MSETVEQGCLRVFREIAGLKIPDPVAGFDDARLLSEPLDAIALDSLSQLEFIMRVETLHGVELDEAKVYACQTIREIAALVRAAAK
jgi:acyl carrier protein